MSHQAGINEMQFGFMLGSEITDSLFKLKELLKKYQTKDLPHICRF